MRKMQQYTCPACGAIGAHPADLRAPLCHGQKCNYKVTMKPSQNGKIMETNHIVEFRGVKCKVEKSRYSEGQRVALVLTAADNGEPVLIPTVNMIEVELEPNQALIKDYSEAKGILDVLIAAKIVSVPEKGIEIDYGTHKIIFPIVEVLI